MRLTPIHIFIATPFICALALLTLSYIEKATALDRPSNSAVKKQLIQSNRSDVIRLPISWARVGTCQVELSRLNCDVFYRLGDRVVSQEMSFRNGVAYPFLPTFDDFSMHDCIAEPFGSGKEIKCHVDWSLLSLDKSVRIYSERDKDGKWIAGKQGANQENAIVKANVHDEIVFDERDAQEGTAMGRFTTDYAQKDGIAFDFQPVVVGLGELTKAAPALINNLPIH
jgi:hypothetical protein